MNKKQELADITFFAAKMCHEEGETVVVWDLLFKWAALNWTSNTPRQVEQRKLAATLWQLTGALGSIKNLNHRNLPAGCYFLIGQAEDRLEAARDRIKAAMKTIKTRIPA